MTAIVGVGEEGGASVNVGSGALVGLAVAEAAGMVKAEGGKEGAGGAVAIEVAPVTAEHAINKTTDPANAKI